MNLVDATIVKILGPPNRKYGKWWIKVKVEAWGVESETHLMANTKKEIETYKVGSEVLI